MRGLLPSPPAAIEGLDSPPPGARISHAVRQSRAGRWVAAGTTSIVCAGLAGYLYFVDPNVPTNAYPQCPLKVLTGVDCPGCGGLRATHSLVHGDIAGAISHNVLALVIVPIMAYIIARWVLGLFGRELPLLRLPRWSGYAIPIGVLVFTVLRNVPYGPLYYFNSAA